MALTVEISADPDTVRGLERDLRDDPDLRGTRLTRIVPAPRPGEMGLGADALHWVTENNALLGALVGGVAGYLARQRVPTRVRVKVGEREVEIESGRPKDVEAIARELMDGLADDDV